MKRGPILFLQIVVVLVGIGVLALMLWEPHIEGRNAHATIFEIYFKDPFLAYAYIASTPFFVALYQTFKLLGYAGRDAVFSHAAVKSLRRIKHCAMAMIGLIAIGLLLVMMAESDDRAGGVVIAGLFIFISTAAAAAAALFERIARTGADLKSENDKLHGHAS